MDNSIQQKLIRGVVEVQVVLTHATFQTEPAGTYVGTAFLVDKNNGLFFTAAHLVCGPTWGFVKSHNYELVSNLISFNNCVLTSISVKLPSPRHYRPRTGPL